MAPGKRSKKDYLDSTDREILRLLHGTHRPVTGRQIALKVNKSSPAIKPRLKFLERRGFIKPTKAGKNRIYTRTIKDKPVKMTIPSKVWWGLDIKPVKKGKTRISGKKK